MKFDKINNVLYLQMGTSSRIGIIKGGKIRSIYVHFDGYVLGVGKFLVENLETEEKIEEFISHGDRSSVESNDYYKDSPEQEDNHQSDFITEFVGRCLKQYCEYFYLFYGGEWNVANRFEDYNLENNSFTFSSLKNKLKLKLIEKEEEEESEEE